jgi:hypothetical protein
MLSDSEWLYIPIFSGDGDPVVLKEGEVGRVGIFQGFSVVAPAKVVDVSISTYEPGEILVPDHPAPGEDGRECRRGVTAEPAGEGSYLCTLGVRMSEAAKPGVRYEGKVTLTFRATCTAKTGYPCEKLPDHYAPSPDNPIDVTFIAEGPLIFEKEKQV